MGVHIAQPCVHTDWGFRQTVGDAPLVTHNMTRLPAVIVTTGTFLYAVNNERGGLQR